MLPRILPAGYDSGFSPTLVSGLKCWLRSDAGLFQDTFGSSPVTADGQSVALWKDQSGNGKHFVQGYDDPTNLPTYKTNRLNGKPSVLFDGTTDWLQASSSILPAPSAWTIFAVVKHNVGSAGIVVSGFDTDSLVGWQVADNFHIVTQADGIATRVWTTAALVSGTWRQFNNKFSGTNIPTRVNGAQSGSQVNSGSFTSLGTLTEYMGANVSTVSFPPTPQSNLDGEIAEIIIYNVAISATNVTNIETYFSSRYGI